MLAVAEVVTVEDPIPIVPRPQLNVGNHLELNQKLLIHLVEVLR
jgi:hypothetical protein